MIAAGNRTSVVAPLYEAWAAHLHDADPTNFAHLAADAEYLPRSPLAEKMRAAITAEQHRRGGEGRG